MWTAGSSTGYFDELSTDVNGRVEVQWVSWWWNGLNVRYEPIVNPVKLYCGGILGLPVSYLWESILAKYCTHYISASDKGVNPNEKSCDRQQQTTGLPFSRILLKMKNIEPKFKDRVILYCF